MRRTAEPLLLILSAVMMPHASAFADEPPIASAEAPALAVLPPPAAAAPASIPRVVAVSPTGDRVNVQAPLVVELDGDLTEAERGALLELDPPNTASLRWRDARTLELSPVRWRAGRAQRVKLKVPGGDASEWVFRTSVPAPGGVLPGEGRRLVLTFDDGPSYGRQADRLLDRLKALEIRALFFPSGRWVKKRPDWVERAVAEGHRVCNHTLSHVNLTAPWMTPERVRSEIEGGAGDGRCKLFRPPLMGFDGRVERIASELGYELYLWDIDSRDWEGAPSEDIVNAVLAAARPEAVVLFHMHAEATFEALEVLAPKLREAGYVLSWEDPGGPGADEVGSGGSTARREWGVLKERPTDGL